MFSNSSTVIIGNSANMLEIENDSIDLTVTSPPYWNIKDYKSDGQIGYGQSLHEYLNSIFFVWEECYRVLKDGTRLCINIGDQFLRSVDYGRYRIVPIHAEFTTQCSNIGFDYMGSIIWQKKTTMNTTGGANVMGSYPYPPNGIIEMDYEYILIFKKPGKKKIQKSIKEKSKLTKEEWKTYFSGHWNFSGERQGIHEAMFPEELPRRLIKMFTFVDDTVLDPFLGSGTTAKVSLDLNRSSIGYELNEDYLPIIKNKLLPSCVSLIFGSSAPSVKIVKQRKISGNLARQKKTEYTPGIGDLEPVTNIGHQKSDDTDLFRVVEVLNENTLMLNTGLKVKLLGTNNNAQKNFEAINYLREYVKGKQVFLKYDPLFKLEDDKIQAYLFLKNKIFINKEMIKLGFADIPSYNFGYKDKFMKLTLENSHG